MQLGIDRKRPESDLLIVTEDGHHGAAALRRLFIPAESIPRPCWSRHRALLPRRIPRLDERRCAHTAGHPLERTDARATGIAARHQTEWREQRDRDQPPCPSERLGGQAIVDDEPQHMPVHAQLLTGWTPIGLEREVAFTAFSFKPVCNATHRLGTLATQGVRPCPNVVVSNTC